MDVEFYQKLFLHLVRWSYNFYSSICYCSLSHWLICGHWTMLACLSFIPFAHGVWSFFFFIYLFIYLFIYGCVGSSFLCEGFPQLWQAGATLHHGVRASSLSRPLLLRSTGSRHAGSVIVAHGPSCSAACGILPDQGSNPCPLHWQADSQPLCHQGSLILLMCCSIWFGNILFRIFAYMFISDIGL